VRAKWPALFVNPPGAAYEILFDSSQVNAAEAEDAARLEARGLPASWGRTGVVYEDPYTIVVRDAVRRPDGSLGTYARTLPASGGAGAAVLPLLDGEIVLLRQFRHATRSEQLEIPRGFGEPGVTAADQARAELREEIQAEAHSLVSLGGLHPNTGAASGCTELFLAHIHDFGEPQAAEGITRIEPWSAGMVAESIGAGAITDSFTIAAFTRAWLRGLLKI
jgi:ADP-ribose diphosphatase